jgi:nicotinamidase-related amidase
MISSSTALLIVDMQYGDAHPDYGLLKAKRERGDVAEVDYYVRRLDQVATPNMCRLLDAFRAAGAEVLFVRIQSLTQDGRDRGPEHKAKGIHFPPGSKDGEILDVLRPRPDELVFSKTCGSAFPGTSLEYVLRSMGKDCLALAGVVTGSCVEATARDALARGFAVTIIEDATASWSDAMQAEAIDRLRQRGADVLSTDAALESLAAAAPQ